MTKHALRFWQVDENGKGFCWYVESLWSSHTFQLEVMQTTDINDALKKTLSEWEQVIEVEDCDCIFHKTLAKYPYTLVPVS